MIAIELVKLLILIVSLFGYYRILNIKLGVNGALCPGIIVCFHGCILFLAGLINALLYALYALPLFGILLLFCSLIKSKNKSLNDVSVGKRIDEKAIIFIIFVIYLYFRLMNEYFYGEDNFNHWAVIIKHLYINSRLPENSDSVIVFQAYPVGTAVFIWYIIKFLGNTEGNCLFAQSLLNLCCAYSVFAFIDRKKSNYKLSLGLGIYAVIFFVSNIFTTNNGLFDLTVDVTLGAVAIAAAAIVLYYKDNLVKAGILIAPILSFEICVKNSGIFFVIAVVALELFLLFASSKKYNTLYSIIALDFIVPLAFRMFWNQHIKAAFSSENTEYFISKTEYTTHEMTLNYYSKILGEKSISEVLFTIRDFALYLFSIPHVIFIIAITFALIKICSNNNIRLTKDGRGLLIYSTVIYICYEIGILLIYIFSMKYGEAEDFVRYSLSIEKFIAFIFLYLLLTKLQQTDKDFLSGIFSNSKLYVLLTGLILFVYSFGAFGCFFIHMKYRSFGRIKDSYIETFESENIIPDDSKAYIVYVSDSYDEYYYRKHLLRYYLYSPYIQIVDRENIGNYTVEDFRELGYDYLVVWDKDQYIEEYFEMNDIEIGTFTDINER